MSGCDLSWGGNVAILYPMVSEGLPVFNDM